MALFFGIQSLQAYSVFGWLPQIYRDAGFGDATAGVLLGVTTATSIPLSFVLPTITAGSPRRRTVLLGLCVAYLAGYAGLILAPARLPWLWAVLVGVGTSIFPMVLTLIGMRARTAEGTAALSGFAQGVGYLLAGVGPFMMGALNGATGSWTAPLLVLMALVVPQAWFGLRCCVDDRLEDQLARRTP